MRAPLVIAVSALVSIALAACGNNDQHDNSQNIDENLTAENIVSNDVTAIDAVTGSDANIAADAAIDDIGGPLPATDSNGAAPAAKPGQAKPAATAKPAPETATGPTSNGGTGNTTD